MDGVDAELTGDIEVGADWTALLSILSTYPEGLFEERPDLANAADDVVSRELELDPPDVHELAHFKPGDIDELEVVCSQFGDEQLRAMLHLTGLRALRLRDHDVSDQGLVELGALDGLRFLTVDPRRDGSSPSNEAVQRLQEHDPWLSINDTWVHPELQPYL